MSILANLEELRNVDVKTVRREDLVDIRDVQINMDLSQEERALDFINQVGNLFCFKLGEMVVKLDYPPDCEDTLEDRLKNLSSTKILRALIEKSL